MLKASLEDIMSEDVVTIKDNATVGQAAHILLRFRINGILIVDQSDKNSVKGVLTTTDLLRLLDNAMSEQKKRKEAIENVSKRLAVEVANKDVVNLQKDIKIERAIALMHRRNIHTIPVYEGERLVGIVGRHDILNLAFSY